MSNLQEVLCPNGVQPVPEHCRYVLRKVRPFVPSNEREQALLERAGQRVRALYLAGQRRLAATENRDPTPFMEACADTALAAYELGNALEDDGLLSVAWGVCKAAGVLGAEVMPTTLEAQVRMQIEVVEQARTLYPLLARQQALEIA